MNSCNKEFCSLKINLIAFVVALLVMFNLITNEKIQSKLELFNYRKVINETRKSVVYIKTADNKSAGSGVIISEDGYIVTNHHVTGPTAEVVVRLHDHTIYRAKAVARYESLDFSLLKIYNLNKKLSYAKIANSYQIGERVFAIGNPHNLFLSASQGIISANRFGFAVGASALPVIIQTDTAINPGNSGGGLFNLKGELIGITWSKLNADNIGFAIPINTFKEILKEYKR